jgi:hypothetical protein
MKVKTALGAWLIAGLLELLGARLLDRLGLIEGLLSPSGASPALLIPLALLFYASRLFAWFIAPGLVLGAVGVSFRPKPRASV